MRPTYEFPELPVLPGAVLGRLSDQEFFELCQANPNLRLERTADYDIIIMPPCHPDADESSTKVSFQLEYWNQQQQPSGHSYGASAGFQLPNGAIRSPDAAWLSRARRAAAQPAGGFLAVCPELMVEVRSPSDALAPLQAKMEEYLANGAQLGFLLDPAHETAYVYRPGQPVETVVGFDRALSGEPVLPGFALDLRPLRQG